LIEDVCDTYPSVQDCNDNYCGLDESPPATPTLKDFNDEDEETFDQFLDKLIGEQLLTPIEVEKALDISLAPNYYDDDDEDNNFAESSDHRGGRKSAEDGKRNAFEVPLMEALHYLSQPYNHLCPLKSNCTRNISATSKCELRNNYFFEYGKPAPKDKERGEKRLKLLKKPRKTTLVISYLLLTIKMFAHLHYLGYLVSQ
jgi:hypothetical protein